MWPFSKVEPEEKGKYDTPINTFEYLMSLPKIYGFVVKKTGIIGVCSYPIGSQSEMRQYFLLTRHYPEFSSDLRFKTEIEAWDYLFEREKILADLGITLDPRSTQIKLLRVTGELKTDSPT